MQGFNMGRYRPADVDPEKVPFNGGRHALGARARRLESEGVLIVRFELPFHVWCGQCHAHLAQGTRFNAHKKHVGDYLGTKIWGFGCKCSRCGGWFQVRTDPEHARYTVHEGARQQKQDWDPEQHGGFPIYDSDAQAESSKGQNEQEERKRTLRLRQLEALADSRGADPYTLNSALRSSFRKDKRLRTSQLEKDIALRDKLGWHHDRQLLPESTPRTTRRDAKRWAEERLEAQKPGSSSTPPAANDLRSRLIANTRAKSDPFLQQVRRSVRTPAAQPGSLDTPHRHT